MLLIWEGKKGKIYLLAISDKGAKYIWRGRPYLPCLHINLSLLLFFFISQSLSYLGSLLTSMCSIPFMSQCQVQRQGLSSTLVSNLFWKLTPNIGTVKTDINLTSNILQLPCMSTHLS